ncbi:hypothetical protein [Gynurincola endophyticus]|uniref:hypothetical protein n=1 Tax=Gynurincola endophyticus TaxID=2479004 RepID=UPI000F8ECB0A|nr:hypothetical protein [Gynurincola endophyticus]
MNLQRYTIMVFPQRVEGNSLSVNIVLIPKNYSPFTPYNLGVPNGNQLIPFATFQPNFKFKWLKKTEEWPVYNATASELVTLTSQVDYSKATRKELVLRGIETDFNGKINADIQTDKAEQPLEINRSVNKYLPHSYRDAFNFTQPRHSNAKIDDSYHCAMKAPKDPVPNWQPDVDKISWGQIYAHILRQPMLAMACGFIYSATIELTDEAKKGGYLFCEIINEEYRAVQAYSYENSDNPFIKSYAARIPALDKNRPVFAPVLFPVLFKSEVHPLQVPIGNWDQVFAEANQYNDGFAKIVHANQPVSVNILEERNDGTHPSDEAGIRLAWDDEQILEWYIRQLAKAPGESKRIDAPIGIYGYAIDVKKDDSTWQSLNTVVTKANYQIGGTALNNDINQSIELPYQVFPTQIDNNKNQPFWLPMYFTHWTGKNMVLKDTDAIEIFRNETTVDPNNMYHPAPLEFELTYGHEYEFRVRMKDLSGGGPSVNEKAVNIAASPTAKWHFRRFLNPNLCRVELPPLLKNNKVNYFNATGSVDNPVFERTPVIEVKRPLLGYPAVLFTNKYSDAVQKLKAITASIGTNQGKVPALADPDVTHLNIRVYVESLGLDHQLSETGKDNYILLYETKRAFSKSDFDAQLNVPVQFMDIPVLSFGNVINPFNRNDLLLEQVHQMNALPLPTARNVKVVVAGICEGDEKYFGNISSDRLFDSRYGKEHHFAFYHPSLNETNLLQPLPLIQPLQGIYLQPDAYPEALLKKYDLADQFALPNIMQRLAQQLHLNHNGMTLMGRKGHRVIFGCSERIRHHLAPDHSSVTFGSKSDLQNHWLVVTAYQLNRDWSWQGNEDISFTIKRDKRWWRDNNTFLTAEKVGELSLKRTASFESLQADDFGIVNRSSTTLIFIDAVDPKKDGYTSNPFPDEIYTKYSIEAHLKPAHQLGDNAYKTELRLPCTVPPVQMPEIVGVGIAFSKYEKNEKYSATTPRKKHLWVELKEPIANQYDTLFCRVLTYAPDQLLSKATPPLSDYTNDPPLPVDPEYIRVVTPHHTNDLAGFNAMQPLEKAADGNNRFYLMPIPPGLSTESPELFGFFRYEFRVGHAIWSNHEKIDDQLWCTAQGRFGRPIVVSGLQHPAPNLLCQTDRNENRLTVSAPYAESVYKGKKLTPYPPRTSLFAVLYAQVPQADGNGYRNILLLDKLMNLKNPKYFKPLLPKFEFNFTHSAKTDLTENKIAQADMILSLASHSNQINTYQKLLSAESFKQLQTFSSQKLKGAVVNMNPELVTELIDATEKLQNAVPAPQAVPVLITKESIAAGLLAAIQKNATPMAEINFSSDEIRMALMKNGLPGDSPLSVIAVEVFGDITNAIDLMGLSKEEIQKNDPKMMEYYERAMKNKRPIVNALNNSLGQFRILRTSPLTEVPAICCEECKAV